MYKSNKLQNQKLGRNRPLQKRKPHRGLGKGQSQSIREQQEQSIPQKMAPKDCKWGPGGKDVPYMEFCPQDTDTDTSSLLFSSRNVSRQTTKITPLLIRKVLINAKQCVHYANMMLGKLKLRHVGLKRSSRREHASNWGSDVPQQITFPCHLAVGS